VDAPVVVPVVALGYTRRSPNGTRVVECGYRLVKCRTVALGALRDGPAVHSAAHFVVQTGGTPPGVGHSTGRGSGHGLDPIAVTLP
jgi:hypothetical protein